MDFSSANLTTELFEVNDLQSHNHSHRILDTLEIGRIQPVYCKELQPSEYIHASASSLSKFMPISKDMYQDFEISFNWFVVPHQTIWKGWENYFYPSDDYGKALDSPLLRPFIQNQVNLWDVQRFEWMDVNVDFQPDVFDPVVFEKPKYDNDVARLKSAIPVIPRSISIDGAHAAGLRSVGVGNIGTHVKKYSNCAKKPLFHIHSLASSLGYPSFKEDAFRMSGWKHRNLRSFFANNARTDSYAERFASDMPTLIDWIYFASFYVSGSAATGTLTNGGYDIGTNSVNLNAFLSNLTAKYGWASTSYEYNYVKTNYASCIKWFMYLKVDDLTAGVVYLKPSACYLYIPIPSTKDVSHRYFASGRGEQDYITKSVTNGYQILDIFDCIPAKFMSDNSETGSLVDYFENHAENGALLQTNGWSVRTGLKVLLICPACVMIDNQIKYGSTTAPYDYQSFWNNVPNTLLPPAATDSDGNALSFATAVGTPNCFNSSTGLLTKIMYDDAPTTQFFLRECSYLTSNSLDSSVTFDAMPFRAYRSVIAEWWKDLNYQEDLYSLYLNDLFDIKTVNADDITLLSSVLNSSISVQNSGQYMHPNFNYPSNLYPLGVTGYKSWCARQYFEMDFRNYEADYFTSIVPDANAFAQTQVPVDYWNTSGLDMAYSLWQNGSPVNAGSTSVGTTYAATSSGSNGVELVDRNNLATAKSILPTDPNGIVGNFNLETFRTEVRIAQYVNAMILGGKRIRDKARVMFGCVPDQMRLDRPTFIGGSSDNFGVGEIFNQADTEFAPVGDRSGVCLSHASGGSIKFRAMEHCFVICLLCIRPKTGYFTGLRRQLQKQFRSDEFNPYFTDLGEQETYRNELFFSPLDTFIGGRQNVGYLPRNTELKGDFSEVRGDFIDTMDIWHLYRDYRGHLDGVIDSDFMQISPNQFNGMFAMSYDGLDRIYSEIFIKCSVASPLSINPVLKL